MLVSFTVVTEEHMVDLVAHWSKLTVYHEPVKLIGS